MDLKLNTDSWGQSNLKWLGSAHASDAAQTVTLKVDKFTAFGDTIPSGVPLKQAADGTYEPVADAGDSLAGFLLTDQPNRGTHQVAPMVWHGRILPKNLPEKSFDVTTLAVVPGAFTFTTNTEMEG